MKRFLQSEVGATVIWVIASLALAALLAPWIYQGGKHLAATARAEDLPGVVEWLAAACGRAKFGRFFDRSLLLAALVLLPWLLRRIRRLRTVPQLGPHGLVGVSWQSAVVQVLTGCVIAAGLLWSLGIALEAAGVYAVKKNPPGIERLLSKTLVPALAAPLLEEWLFRGLLLGLWLRFARPAAACIGTSLLFAFVHFLKLPDGAVIADPAHPLAGFELLGKILLHFTEPVFFVTDFATLLVVGLILAWARVRTGALWFSIGLHAGWIAAFKAFGMLHRRVSDHPLVPWGVGENLRSGVLPLATLGLTAVACHFVLKRFSAADSAAHHGEHEDLEKPGAA